MRNLPEKRPDTSARPVPRPEIERNMSTGITTARSGAIDIWISFAESTPLQPPADSSMMAASCRSFLAKRSQSRGRGRGESPDDGKDYTHDH